MIFIWPTQAFCYFLPWKTERGRSGWIPFHSKDPNNSQLLKADFVPDILWKVSQASFVVQSLSHVRLFVTPWTATHQASLSITNSNSCPLCRWCHPTVLSSVVPFSSFIFRNFLICAANFKRDINILILQTWKLAREIVSFPIHTEHIGARIATQALLLFIKYRYPKAVRWCVHWSRLWWRASQSP